MTKLEETLQVLLEAEQAYGRHTENKYSFNYGAIGVLSAAYDAYAKELEKDNMIERLVAYKANNGNLFTTEAEARDEDAYCEVTKVYTVRGMGYCQLRLNSKDMKPLYELLKGHYNDT